MSKWDKILEDVARGVFYAGSLYLLGQLILWMVGVR